MVELESYFKVNDEEENETERGKIDFRINESLLNQVNYEYVS